MMNEENKVMKALVNLMVCPRCPGSTCCKRCSYIGTDGCYESLVSDSMKVLNAHFGEPMSAPSISASDCEAYVVSTMRTIGVPAHVLGYQYVVRAITLAVNNSEYLHAITSMLYPTIAKEFGATPARVERAIRHAIEVAWQRGDLDVLLSYFGNTLDPSRGKPTNSEFIATIAEHVKLNLLASSSK